MTENMKKYLELLSKDEEAQKKLNEQQSASIEEAKGKIIADAAEKGITVTEEDFAEDTGTGELSDDELDAVAGGKDCFCVIGGGGEVSSAKERTCACVGFGMGQGYMYNRDIGEEILTSRCGCYAAGSGGSID